MSDSKKLVYVVYKDSLLVEVIPVSKVTRTRVWTDEKAPILCLHKSYHRNCKKYRCFESEEKASAYVRQRAESRLESLHRRFGVLKKILDGDRDFPPG